jgi:hypothetical protein
MSAGIDPTVVVASGLLEADGLLSSDLTVEAATGHLREILAASGSPITVRAEDGASNVTLLAPPAARWEPPVQRVSRRLGDVLHAAWSVVTDEIGVDRGVPPALRVRVDELGEVEALRALGPIEGVALVPQIERHARRFTWRWPLRVGIARGPRSAEWAAQIGLDGEFGFYSFLYDVRVVDDDDDGPVDILLVDSAVPRTGASASCVILVDPGTSSDASAERALSQWDAAITVGLRDDGVSWFPDTIARLAHDEPFDVAITSSTQDASIGADPRFVDLTSARRWALAAHEQFDPSRLDGSVDDLGARLLLIGTESSFSSETIGASAISYTVREMLAAGVDPALHFDEQSAADPGLGHHRIVYGGGGIENNVESDGTHIAHGDSFVLGDNFVAGRDIRFRARLPLGDGTDPGAPPDVVIPSLTSTPPTSTSAALPAARRLIANVSARGRRRASTLLPEVEHELIVKIAVPQKRDVAADADFPEHHLPANAIVRLTVHITCPELDLRDSSDIVLQTTDRTAPSTPAVFHFVAPGEGDVVDIGILVLHNNRPLVESHLVATSRRAAVDDERIRLIPVPLSTSPEPRVPSTPADYALQVQGANLLRTGTDQVIEIASVTDQLNRIEQLASRALGVSGATPPSLGDDKGRGLLIDLARLGSQILGALAPLDLGTSGTISVLVDATTSVLPFELAYDLPVPEKTARLCEHAHLQHADLPDRCSIADVDVVCPLGFWGQRRIVARTIRLPKPRKGLVEPESITLAPALYAAADKADVDAVDGERPSDVLHGELAEIVGADAVVRVRNWNAWRTAVQASRPQLLVVLGHAETSGNETIVEIGERSRLASPDVRRDVLREADAPAPLLVLLTCSSAVPRNPYGGLTAAFTRAGAAAVVATLTKLHGLQGARAAASVVRALHEGTGDADGATLGQALTVARRRLVAKGSLVGLLLVSHGEIDLVLTR